MMEKLLLLDSNSLLHRAYYALQSSNLTDSKGNPTGAVYGFVSMFARLVHEEKPSHVAAAFDLKAPTFRHKMYEAYKGTRKPMPDDLAAQVPVLKKLVAELGVKIVELEGYEADDILGTLSDKFDVQTVIVTGDRDSLQLIDDNTVVLYTKRGITDVVRYDRERLKEEGFTPEKIIDYKALRGDVSDNIPGIPGIGEKTALNLLNEYGTLEKVLENAESVPGKLGEKIRDGKDSARLSYELATIKRDVPIAVELDDL
ncbi:MAG: 5'-3' exonuclease H3TH domain-containing protein, partial [Eubacteriales bacterium]|nr:5'-3' exonuclease H3TH domain-containing protein [Eubacteriales bacterium]